jgi:hypothetical protein
MKNPELNGKLTGSGNAELLLTILFISLLLNTIGITWGLPSNWHPDNKLKHVVQFLRTNDLNPRLLINPTLPVYLFYLISRIVLFFKRTISYSDIVVFCRLFQGIIGTLNVYIVYKLSSLLFKNKKIALFTALSLAVCAANVIYSHFCTPEILLVCLTLCTVLFIIKCQESLDIRDYYLACIFFGLGMSTKYTIFPMFLFIAFSYIFMKYKKGILKNLNIAVPEKKYNILLWVVPIFILIGIFLIRLSLIDEQQIYLAIRAFLKNPLINESFWNEIRNDYIVLFSSKMPKLLLLGGIGSILFALILFEKRCRYFVFETFLSKEFLFGSFLIFCAFVITTPYAILDYRQFLHDNFVNWQTQFYYGGMSYSGSSFMPYLKHVTNLLTMPVFVCSLLGIVVLKKEILKIKYLTIVTIIGFFYVFLSTRANASQRFILPIIPFFLIFFANFLYYCLKEKRNLIKKTGIVIVILSTIFSLVYSINANLILVNDSRIIANKWIEENIPKNKSIACFSYQRYLPNFSRDRNIKYIGAVQDLKSDFGNFVEWFEQNKTFDYIILSDMFYARHLNSKQYPQRSLFYKKLLNEQMGYKIVKEFFYDSLLKPKVDFANPKLTILKKIDIE